MSVKICDANSFYQYKTVPNEQLYIMSFGRTHTNESWLMRMQKKTVLRVQLVFSPSCHNIVFHLVLKMAQKKVEPEDILSTSPLLKKGQEKMRL